MATTYTSSVSIRCLKQHTCVCCESKFTYTLVRNLKGTGTTAAAAEANAAKMAMKSVETDVDFHPCPACGAVQPEMASVVVSRHFKIAAVVALVGISSSLIAGFARMMHTIPCAWIGVGATAVAVLEVLYAIMYAPNRDLDGNRMKSEMKVQAGTIRLDHRAPEKPGLALVTPNSQLNGHRFAALLCYAAVAATSAPPVLQMVNSWPTNTTCYPEVVGSGDSARFYFDKKITCVNAKWRGDTTVAVANAKQLGVNPRLSATTKDETWGDTISGKNVSNSTVPMYVDVAFAPEPDVGGKSLALNLGVRATFPFDFGNKRFDNRTAEFHHAAEVTLAPPGAGTTFYRSWWEGELMAAALVIVALLMAMRSSKTLAAEGNPTVVSNAADNPPAESA